MSITDKEWKELIVKVSNMDRDLTRIVGIIDGRNGNKGLEKIITEFMSLWAGREEERKIYDDRQERKNNTIIALGILILALLAFFGIKAHLESHAIFSGDSSVTSADYNIK